MLILIAVLTALLAIPGGTAVPAPPGENPAPSDLGSSEVGRAIKAELESVSGEGTVEVAIRNRTNVSVRIAIQRFSSKVCRQIYDHELGLHQLFPDLNLEFTFNAPELARAIRSDLESISGIGTVDVSVDGGGLLSVRVITPGPGSDVYSRIFDREIEFYRAFPDLNFDFYLRAQTVSAAPSL